MARPKANQQVTEDEVSSFDQIESFLSTNKEYHYNDVKQTKYSVSSGSLKLDLELGGGVKPGIVRFSGVTEGGKTSASLSFAKNFQNTVKNGFILYFKAEGRLSEELLERSGVDTSPSKWKVIKSNVYEVVVQLINELIHNNPNDIKYMFIIDSMDSLNLKEDMNRVFGTSNKVAGAAGLSADFLKKMALPISEFGHLCVMISQIRTMVSINPYEKKDPRITNSSGGNALLHYSDWIFEFQNRTKSDLITTQPQGKGDILGHFCKIVFRKSPNEKTNKEIRYPIKYGRKNGQSVWVEYEVFDLILAYQLASAKGPWITFEKAIVEQAKNEGVELPEKVNGEAKLIELLESNQNITNFFVKEFKRVLEKII